MIMWHWKWCYHNSKDIFMFIIYVILMKSIDIACDQNWLPFGICTTNVIVKLSSSLVILQWLSFEICESGKWCSHTLMVERESYFQMILVVPNVLQCMHLALILLLYLACAFCIIILYNCHIALNIICCIKNIICQLNHLRIFNIEMFLCLLLLINETIHIFS